ncbi:uncharacterized protein EDB93DRAFT_1102746 [Suillus bovinus]|uniref:uncharacterized protein n=1 Tax=Suillus bovinus TaxID=48563 RepID=UPI001B87971F|nr:uncharacterized protein EDB93DRAFT_1102746 [Suillus bovinus]KAG2152976.1 hypothetical protein EDB93DRAFT_1102746 [Suillus bovinus]
MPLVSLGLADADAPQCSICSNAETGVARAKEFIQRQLHHLTLMSQTPPSHASMNVPKKFSKNTDIGHTRAPPTTGFSEQMLDPVLHDTSQAKFQLIRVHSSANKEDRDEEENEDDKNNEDDEDNENDGDNPNNGDKENVGPEGEMREQEICWGEVGFSREELPSCTRLPPSRCLTPEFEFTFSHDKDNTAAQTSLTNSTRRPGMESQGPSSYVQQHDTSQGLPDPMRSNKPTQCSKVQGSKKPSNGPKPTQLAWYRPCWKSFLEDVKGKCHTIHTSENPFLTLVKDLSVSVAEVLVAVLITWDKDGKKFEDGIWPEHKPDMERLKTVMSIVPVQYSLIPPPSVPAQQSAGWIKTAAVALLENSLFLCHGVDRMFNCILDGLKKNGNGKYYPKFTANEYGPIYRKMLQLLSDIMKDCYHGPVMLAQLWEWAQAGWAKLLKVDGDVGASHDHLQIFLD